MELFDVWIYPPSPLHSLDCEVCVTERCGVNNEQTKSMHSHALVHPLFGKVIRVGACVCVICSVWWLCSLRIQLRFTDFKHPIFELWPCSMQDDEHVRRGSWTNRHMMCSRLTMEPTSAKPDSLCVFNMDVY